MMNLFEVTMDITRRLTGIFLRDDKGRRPVYGGNEKFQTDPQREHHPANHDRRMIYVKRKGVADEKSSRRSQAASSKRLSH